MRVKRGRVLLNKTKNIPLEEEGLVFIGVTWVVFYVAMMLFVGEYISCVVHQMSRGTRLINDLTDLHY